MIIIIKIINKSRHLTTQEIKDCLSLLKRKYTNLDVEVKLYNNEFQFLFDYLIPCTRHKEINWSWFSRVLKGKVRGWYCNQNQNIKIFTFNGTSFKDKEEIRIQLMYDLLHELRHAYQVKNMTKRYMYDSENYVIEGPNYSKQWIEIDANKFAREFMNKKKDEINKILNIKGEWDFQ